MGIQNREGALYAATGIDNTGLYAGRREAIGIIKAMAGEITSFDVFGGIGISAGIAFAQAAKGAYDFEKQFQQSMKEVATLSSGIKGSLTDYMNQVVDVTKTIPVQANDAAKALYQIVSAGHDGADGMKILEVSAKAAIGGVTDTATAADTITTVLNAYKMDASQAQKVSDLLFTTVRLGKTTFGELGHSIAQAAPIAASYGVEIDQVLAAVASLTKQGTPTAQAMTQIRASIIGVSKVLGDGAFNGRTYQEALEEVANRANSSESKLRELVPEVEAVNAVLGMTGKNAESTASDLEQMGNSAGAAEAAFKEMASSAQNQLQLLQNNITASLRPMGEAILKEVSGIATAFNEAFANGDVQESMKTLGALIVAVTGAYVGYKGSILAVSTAKQVYASITAVLNKQRTLEIGKLILSQGFYDADTAAVVKNTSARVLLIKAIKTQIATQLKNTAAMMTNPYVLAAAAVAALGYGIYKLVTAETAAERAVRKHNEEQQRFQKTLDERKQKIDELIRTIQDEVETEYNKIKAYEELQRYSPALVAAYSREELATLELAKSQKVLNEERDKMSYENIISQVDKYTQYVKLLKSANTWNDLGDSRKPIKSEYGIGLISNIAEEAEADLIKWKNTLDEYNRLKKQAEEEAKPVEIRILEAKADIEQIQSEFDKAKKKLEEEQEKLKNNPFYVIPFQVQIAFDIAKNKLDAQQNNVSNLAKDESKITTYQQDLAMAKEDWLKAKAGYEAILKDQKATSEVVKKAKENLDTKEKAYKDLGGVTDSSKLKTQAEQLQKQQESFKQLLNKQAVEQVRAAEDLENQTEQARINAMKEGNARTLEQMKLDHAKEMQQLKRQREDALLTIIENERAKFEADPQNKGKKFDASGIKLSGTQTANFDNQEAYIREKQANENKAYLDEQRRSWDEYLLEYSNFQEKKLALKRIYDDKIANATTAGEKASLKKEFETKDKELNLDEIKSSINFADIFGNLDAQSTDAIKILRDKLKEIIEKSAKDLKPTDLKALQDALQNMDLKIAERDPFSELKNGLDNYKASCKDVETAQSTYNATLEKGWTIVSKYDEKTGKTTYSYISQKQALEGLTDAQRKKKESQMQLTQSVNSIGEKGQQVVQAGNDLVDMLTSLGIKIPESVAGALSGVGQIMDGLASIDITKPMSIVTGSVKMLAGLGKTIGSIFGLGGDSNTKKHFEDLKEQLDGINKIYEKIIENSKEKITFGEGFAAINAAADAMDTLNKKLENYRSLVRAGIEYKDGTKENAGWHSNKNVGAENFSRMSELVGKSITSVYDLVNLDAEELYTIMTKMPGAWGAMDEHVRTALEDIVECKDEAKELGDALNEAVTGVSFDSFYNGFIDQLADMDASSEEFANNFEGYLRKSIMASIVANNYKGQIEKLYNDWAKYGNDQIYSEDEIKDLRKQQEDITNAMLSERENLANTFGWESSSSSQEATKGSFETMSQDTGTELNGRFTAFQASNEEIKNQNIIQTGIQQEILKNLEFLYNFNYTSTTETRDMMNAVIDYLYDIKKDTAHLYFIRESLKKIENNTR